MKHLFALSLATLLAAAGPALAQDKTSDHDTHHADATASPRTEDSTAAEVRKVDRAAKKITLKHEAIRNLDMPPMTMVFQVQDAALLDKVKAGDQVRFTADKVNGAYVVRTIAPAQN